MININPMQKWERFWRLVILWEIEKRNSWIFEKCLCDCWNTKWVSRNHLRMWRCKSCWCIAKEKGREMLTKMKTKHWMFWTHFYNKYELAYSRCNNPKNASYHRYWWRWIKLLWKTFEEFKNDMYETYINHVKEFWEVDTTLDRININWDYCKENCRWATRREQANNRSNNIYVTYKWETMSLPDLCRKYNANYDLVRARYYNWQSIEDALCRLEDNNARIQSE